MQVVWVILPDQQEVVVVQRAGESRYGRGERLAPHPALPDLIPEVDRFFRQLG